MLQVICILALKTMKIQFRYFTAYYHIFEHNYKTQSFKTAFFSDQPSFNTSLVQSLSHWSIMMTHVKDNRNQQ